ncbi:hypothetical protein M0R45_014535 [Rubus argutus]|uniref:AP2/ERF domain-containing protein n=1 Tax=Rubus argutus TaxID=59490 RepID=A0AAW1XN63_RUBAR
MVTDLDLESQILGFRVRRRKKKKAGGNGKNRKEKQTVVMGTYSSVEMDGGLFDKEEEASRAYGLAALKLCGESTPLNFPVSDYENEVEDMKAFSKKDCMLHIRRNMTRFAKGMSKCRGVSK